MHYISNDLNTTDKYDLAKFMELDENGVFDSIGSYFLYQIPLLPLLGEHTIRNEENRPDLLSYNIYGDTQYWWILMWYNNMMKPQDLKIGVKIKYPSLSSIEDLYKNTSMLKKAV